jgi:hypothetical protein
VIPVVKGPNDLHPKGEPGSTPMTENTGRVILTRLFFGIAGHLIEKKGLLGTT